MISTVHRNVILDLLPPYVSGEASAETRALVRQALDEDPTLASLAERGARELTEDPPAALGNDRALEVFRIVKRTMLLRTLGLSALFSLATLVLIALIIGAALVLMR